MLFRPHQFRVVICYLLWAGLIILLSATSAWAAEKYHVVKPHQTLGAIAREYGVTASEIARRNQLKNSSHLVVGQRLLIPEAPKPSEYSVKKGDSLASIAKTAGISVAALSDLNELKEARRLTVGQVILLPGRAKSAAREKTTVEPDLKASLDKIRCSPRWGNIVIHHSGSFLDTPQSMDQYHRARHMENGLAYHFVIGSGKKMEDGGIYVGNRWIKQLDGGHLASEYLNSKSIGICLVGNFNQRSPSAKQMKALHNLTEYLMARCHLNKENIKTHRQINTRPTQCPGSKFPTAKFVAGL